MTSPVAARSAKMPLSKWRVGCTRLVSSVHAALDAAVASGGFVRPLSYQSAALEEAGLLRRVLTAYEPAPIPIHLVHPAGRHLPLKTRLFLDRATAALRGRFA